MIYVNALTNRPRNIDNSIFGLFKEIVGDTTLHAASNSLLANVEEFKDKFEMKIFVPGVEKENIDLYVKDGVLSVSVKTEQVKNQTTDEDTKDVAEVITGNVVLREVRDIADMKRSFNFGENISDEVIAVLDKGVLFVTVQKMKPEDKTKKIDIL